MTTHITMFYETVGPDGEPSELTSVVHDCCKDCFDATHETLGIAADEERPGQGRDRDGRPVEYGASPAPSYGDSAEFCSGCGVLLHPATDWPDDVERPVLVSRDPEETETVVAADGQEYPLKVRAPRLGTFGPPPQAGTETPGASL